MLDSAKMQYLSRLVQTSSILNAQEKTEWLTLMQLMNDKQLGELEEILKPAPTPSATPAPAPSMPATEPVNKAASVAPPIQAPPLSHISNLPSRMVDPRLSPKPNPAAQAAALAEAAKAANQAEQQFAQQTRLAPMTAKPAPATPSPISPKPVAAPQPAPPKPAAPSMRSAPLKREAAAIQLLSEEDAAKITADVLHQQNRATFYNAITALAEKFGYFQILSRLEESPLYQSYLEYGKARLTGREDNLPLSQEEFEFVADLLRALKINRL